MNVDKLFIKTFSKIFDEDSFTIKFWDGDEIKIGKDEPLFKIILNKPIPKKDLITSTTLAFGEAYMDGNLEVEGDLLLMLNTVLKYKDKFYTNFKELPNIFSNLTSAKKQKEEVTYHYDIGNDFYRLWLDDTMSYSCGYFRNERDSLYDAQMNKIHHLLKKLDLKEGLSLLAVSYTHLTLPTILRV